MFSALFLLLHVGRLAIQRLEPAQRLCPDGCWLHWAHRHDRDQDIDVAGPRPARVRVEREPAPIVMPTAEGNIANIPRTTRPCRSVIRASVRGEFRLP